MQTPGKLAGAAFFVAGYLNVSCPHFYPESCLSGHDNITAVPYRETARRNGTFIHLLMGRLVNDVAHFHALPLPEQFACFDFPGPKRQEMVSKWVIEDVVILRRVFRFEQLFEVNWTK